MSDNTLPVGHGSRFAVSVPLSEATVVASFTEFASVFPDLPPSSLLSMDIGEQARLVVSPEQWEMIKAVGDAAIARGAERYVPQSAVSA